MSGAQRATQVVVVGAGPVGLALATDLGRRGVRCIVVEREREHSPLPKMNHVNTRSMELCRRWGVAASVRRCGWPDEHPLDVAYITSFAGFEIARFPFSSQRDREAPAYSPEASQRCPQIWFDPLLERHLATLDPVQLLRGHELEGYGTESGRIVARVKDRAAAESYEIAADYLVGADGAGSRVRELAGIERECWGPAPQQVAIALRARDFFGFHDKQRAAFYFVLDGEGSRAVVTPTDGELLWRFNWNLRPGESLEAFDADAAIRAIAGADFEYEIVTVMPWQIRFTLAERYRLERIFLVGDAARTLSPTGGLGMNTGLADAADLGWKLAAKLAGWGGDLLLDSYDAERRASGRGINEESLRNLARIAAIPRLPGIAAPGEPGERLRRQAARTLLEGDFRLEWSNDGASLGLRYADSPVLASDDATPPRYDANRYEPSSFPGCRAPHGWLPDGRSILDWFGAGFVLLRFGSAAPDCEDLARAAARRGVPLETRLIADPAIAAVYARSLVLVRPDGIVAWRGESPPEDPGALLDRVRGWGSSRRLG